MTASLVVYGTHRAYQSVFQNCRYAMDMGRKFSLGWGETLVMITLQMLSTVSYLAGQVKAQIQYQRMVKPNVVAANLVDTWPHMTPRSIPLRNIVVIPALIQSLAEFSHLERAVHSLHPSLHDDELILVVDDGSPVEFQAMMKALCAPMSDQNILLISHAINRGPAEARNTALRWARSKGQETIDTVCFIDADCVVTQSDWTTLHRQQQKLQPGIVAGRTVAAEPTSWVARFYDLFGTLNGRRLLTVPTCLLYGPTCNLSIHLKELPDGFEFDGQFPTAAFEDVEFCVRARKVAQVDCHFLPLAVVQHEFSSSVLDLMHRFWRYGQGSIQMQRIHPDFDQSWCNTISISNCEYNGEED